MMFLGTILCLAVATQALTVPSKTDSRFSEFAGSSVKWNDCGDDGGSDDRWVRLNNFGLTPNSLHLPGHVQLTMQGSTSHAVHENVVLDVQVYKELLSSWTHVPCTGDLGSCQYSDPCHFMQVFFPDGNCPQEFTDNNLPCTCPFNIDANQPIKVDHDALELPAVKPEYTWLSTGEYYIKMVMYQKGQATERMCLEFFVNLVKG